MQLYFTVSKMRKFIMLFYTCNEKLFSRFFIRAFFCKIFLILQQDLGPGILVKIFQKTEYHHCTRIVYLPLFELHGGKFGRVIPQTVSTISQHNRYAIYRTFQSTQQLLLYQQQNSSVLGCWIHRKVFYTIVFYSIKYF